MKDKLTKAVLAEISKIRKNGPTDVDLKKAQETLIRERETDMEKNEFWVSKIESVYYDNADPATIMNFRDRVNAVTAKDLREETVHYLKADHYLRVCLVPAPK
jgi:zinc protease